MLKLRNLDETCLKIIEILYRNPHGLGFNKLCGKGFNRKTLRNHLQHLIPHFVKPIDVKVKGGNQHLHKLTKEGSDLAFIKRREKYGETMKWAEDWINQGWEPIDITDVMTRAPKEIDITYLMRHREKKVAKIVVPPYLDAEVYLGLEGGKPINLVSDVLSKIEIVMADPAEIKAKLEEFITSHKLEARFDPGRGYKRLLGVLKEYVSGVRYVGGPIPFTKEIEHQEEFIRKHRTREEAVKNLAEELQRDIENPPTLGICFATIRDLEDHAYGFWVILNPEKQDQLTEVLKNPKKAETFHKGFIVNLEPFLEKWLNKWLNESLKTC